ncbi:MAG: PAS domain-containing protein, partial [Bacteroidota bacterium]
MKKKSAKRVSASVRSLREKLSRLEKVSRRRASDRKSLRAKFQELQELHRNLVDTRDYLQNLVQYSGDAIISIDRNATILFWNRGAEEIYGYRPQEVIGNSLFMFDPPEIRAEHKRLIQRVFRGESVRNLEQQRLRKDGQPIWVSATLSPVKDASGRVLGVSAIVTDITQRKLLGQQLRMSEERYRTLFEESKDMVFMSDLQGRFSDVNPAGVAM